MSKSAKAKATKKNPPLGGQHSSPPYSEVVPPDTAKKAQGKPSVELKDKEATLSRLNPSKPAPVQGRGQGVASFLQSEPRDLPEFQEDVPGPKKGVEELKGKHKPTEEQQAILDAARDGFKVLIIKAFAGTGKTTSLRMLADVLRGNGQYTAFNSKLVDDSKSKFQGTRVACNTTHSLGFRSEGKRFQHRLNGARVRSDQIAAMLRIEPFVIPVKNAVGEMVEKRLSPAFLAGQVMQAIKRFCQSADEEIQKKHFKYIDGLDVPGEFGRTSENNDKVKAYLLPFAIKAWNDISDENGELPFSHDCYVKLWQLNAPTIAGDYGLLDEAQDTAPVMLDVIEQQIVINEMPWILVGDDYQSIFSWRGATNAMSHFEDGNTKVLYLSQSFRFGVAIANVANAVLETLNEPPELKVKGLPSIDSKVEAIKNPAAIICRTNAVAVTNMLTAISEGKKPFLVGGGGEVVKFVEGARDLQEGKPTSHPDLACFNSWVEVQEYSKLDEGEDLKLMVKLVDGFGAKVILGALKAMPSEGNADVIIGTAHKVKGMEWDSVRLANDFPTVSKSGDDDKMLLYVALTRAKLQLDLTECPFFTGKDAIDISEIIKRVPIEGKPVEGEKPAVAAPEKFTWQKRDEKWVIRGPKNQSGNLVEVFRKDGSSQKKRLGQVIEEFGPVALYNIS